MPELSSPARLTRRGFLRACGTAIALAPAAGLGQEPPAAWRPNFLFILADDLRYDALGCVKPGIRTPNMDALAARGTLFRRAFVTTSICSPSRACCFTGRYASATGVTGVSDGRRRLRPGEKVMPHLLHEAGYRTGFAGKWHLDGLTPEGAGFAEWTYFVSNGSHGNRQVITPQGEAVAEGFIEDHLAAWAVKFLESAAKGPAPFLMHLCTQVPHMDSDMTWKPRPETLALYDEAAQPLPPSWNDDLAGKPPYLKRARSRTQALTYGYDKPEGIRAHWRLYRAAITDMDRALGTVFATLERLGLRDSTVVVLMGDNGWFLGEHGFTSKVLAYEESMRVPMVIAGPGVQAGPRDDLVLNADLAPTFLELAGLEVPGNVHGRSLVPLLGRKDVKWRDAFLYEAPDPELGARPIEAVRTDRWKYIRTRLAGEGDSAKYFEELYDLASDPTEMKNLAADAARAEPLGRMRTRLAELRAEISRRA